MMNVEFYLCVMSVDQQTLQDLEFNTIQLWLEEFANQPTAKERINDLCPIQSFEDIQYQLNKTNELLKIRLEGEAFPAMDFEELDKEIKLLPIENASIPLEGFMRIITASRLVNRLLYFFDKREKEYPLLASSLSSVYFTKEIIEIIEKVFDQHGKVKDDASQKLSEIRVEIKSLRQKINRNFDKEMRKLMKDNILADTAETFLNERRVLTVLSSHKRRVPGTVLGSSNTGSVTYIEPQNNVALNNEMELLLDDERKEIFRILQVLRKDLFQHIELIENYQLVLTDFDFINAKVRLALKLDACLPQFSEELEVELIDAYHPILLENNKKQNKKTYPQNLQMDKFSRMLVISGPNAGGKSITLKSIGLLQIMLQSGLLIPVHPNSRFCYFHHILSDIGDNQSILNELSTYSYRLKRMNEFLQKANRKTLILIDEFGTGSDPDLGGALAEAIFEALYSKKSFGVITTHYANIKLKADQLRNAVNGSMLFDTETLEPLYRFIQGQPGSSFTFEVAKNNGIPDELIAIAKDKLDNKKVKMDKLLSDLQREKNYLERLNEEHIEAQEIAQDARNHFEEERDKYERKLEKLKSSSSVNEKFIQYGKKLDSYIKEYNTRSRNKTINDKLLAEVKKYIAVEKSKIEEAKKLAKAKAIPKPKTKKQKQKPEQDQFNRHKIKVGSRVKLISTKQIGSVEEMKGKNVTVLFGFAKMKVELEKLMWID